MAVYRLVRFTIDPADTGEMLATRAALVTVTRDAFPGLTEARLSKVDDETWIDIWRWDSRASAQAAIEAAPALPEAGAAFSLIKDVTADFAEIVDER
ncbi:MAG TPA: hypothetical protein VGA04_18225 [Streptosporangiaceae bacterium]